MEAQFSNLTAAQNTQHTTQHRPVSLTALSNPEKSDCVQYGGGWKIAGARLSQYGKLSSFLLVAALNRSRVAFSVDWTRAVAACVWHSLELAHDMGFTRGRASIAAISPVQGVGAFRLFLFLPAPAETGNGHQSGSGVQRHKVVKITCFLQAGGGGW